MKSHNRKGSPIGGRCAIKLVVLFFLVIFLSSCAATSESMIQTAIVQTQSNVSINTIQPTYTPYPTYTPLIIVVTATDIPTPKFTATSSLTPTSSMTPTKTTTPTNTVPPTKTATLTATATKTKEPGVGVDMKCGNEFIVNVVTKPQKETYFYGTKPGGEFWLLKVQITNLMNETHQLYDTEFTITAMYNGQEVTFDPNWDATFDWVYHNWGGLIYTHDEIGPTLSAKVGIAFDVNPKATDFHFNWTPSGGLFSLGGICTVSIPLE